MKIWASVLSFQEVEMTSEAIDSIRVQGPIISEIEVIGNGATPKEAADLEELFPIVRLTIQSDNRSFADCVNLSAERARNAGCDFLLFLTNDACLDKGAVASMLSKMTEMPEIAAVMPVQMRYHQPTVIQHGGGTIDRRRWATVLEAGGQPRNALPTTGVVDRDWLDGAGVLYRLSAMEEIGGLWPGFGFYWEDADWGIRAKAKGWRVVVDCEASMRHRVSATTSRNENWRQYMLFRNRILCAKRNCDEQEYRKIARRLLNAAVILRFRSPKRIENRMRLRATIDAIKGRHQDPPTPVDIV